MKVKDAIPSWSYLTWAGSFAGTDTLSVDAATTIIKDVHVVLDKSGKKSISVTVQKKDGNSALAVVPMEQISAYELEIFDRVLVTLKSAIGGTLDQAGTTNIT